MEQSSMKNQEIISKLNSVNEEISILEELTRDNNQVEEKLEELKLIRYELEGQLRYEKDRTFEDD